MLGVLDYCHADMVGTIWVCHSIGWHSNEHVIQFNIRAGPLNSHVTGLGLYNMSITARRLDILLCRLP